MKSLNDEIKKVEERATEAEKGNLSKATDETYSNSLVVLMLAMSANCPPSTPLHAFGRTYDQCDQIWRNFVTLAKF